METAVKTRSGKLTTALVIVVAVLVLLPVAIYLLGVVIDLSFIATVLLGVLIFLVGMPLFFWIMAEAGYKVFLRPSLRARRIRNLREKRLRTEAAARDRE